MENIYYSVYDNIIEFTKLCKITSAFHISISHIHFREYRYTCHEPNIAGNDFMLTRFTNIQSLPIWCSLHITILRKLTSLKHIQCNNHRKLEITHLKLFTRLETLRRCYFPIEEIYRLQSLQILEIHEQDGIFDIESLPLLKSLSLIRCNVTMMQTKPKHKFFIHLRIHSSKIVLDDDVNCIDSLFMELGMLGQESNISRIPNSLTKIKSEIKLDHLIDRGLLSVLPNLISFHCPIYGANVISGRINLMTRLEKLNSQNISHMNETFCLTRLTQWKSDYIHVTFLKYLSDIRKLNFNRLIYDGLEKPINPINLCSKLNHLCIHSNQYYTLFNLHKLNLLTHLTLEFDKNNTVLIQASTYINMIRMLTNLKELSTNMYRDIDIRYFTRLSLQTINVYSLIDYEDSRTLESFTDLKVLYFRRSNVTKLNLLRLPRLKCFSGTIKGKILKPHWL